MLLAHAGIADVWWIRGDNGIVPAREAYLRAQAALSKALALDDSLADVHVIQANCRFANEWDWKGAETEFLRAIKLNPNSAHARFMYSDFLICMRRFDRAQEEIDRVLQLDPFNPFFQCFLGWHLLYLGCSDEAVAQMQKTLRAEPYLPAAHLGLWGAFYRKGRFKDALAEAREFYSMLADDEIADTLNTQSNAQACYTRIMHSTHPQAYKRPNKNQRRLGEIDQDDVDITHSYVHTMPQVVSDPSIPRCHNHEEVQGKC